MAGTRSAGGAGEEGPVTGTGSGAGAIIGEERGDVGREDVGREGETRQATHQPPDAQHTAPARAPERRSLGTKVAVVASAIGLIYGYDTGSISGALVFLESDYHLTTLWTSVITSIVVVGSLVGAAVGPRVANELGRRRAMLAVAFGFMAFAGLSAVPLGLWWLTVVRLLLGVTVGLATVVAPVFISEFASEENRGRLGTAFQFFTCAGVIISLLTAWALSGSESWEAVLGLAAAPAGVVFLALLRFPDSPRWYAMRGMRERALETLRRLDPDADAPARLTAIEADLAESEHGRFREIFAKRYARPTFFVIAFGFAVQITGNNTILYFSPTIFAKAGFGDGADSILASTLVQVVAAVGVVLSMAVVDRWGRRPPLILGTAAMVVGHTVMAFVFAQDRISTGTGYVATAAIGLFYLGFYFGIGSLIWVYTGEAFPARLRSVGAGALLLSDFAANLIATFAFPNVLAAFGGSTAFGAFAVLSALALVFLYRMAPETKGRSLEEIRGYWDNKATWSRAE
ncbi:sugar porter family MFS transporter [Streptomyces tubbatahanensis]|uniref:Sugar porter family MFS transporter n=1 Tax=Streptomyces tubbatahanensis TaxID=2923272 RepID=A0ABY3XLB4_9ACTN|nr:sugar porter family MFS transporter [Streptomyces tubbatahanensis]UNS95202.1 sugar porter family MFS transporter [Streptomyces tubbatahanensis]